jgi:hypothetical protein
MTALKSVKNRSQKSQNMGLTTYAKIKHSQPLLHGVNSLEGILSLVGIVTLILFLLTGSFQSAGQALDQFVHTVTEPIKSILSRLL